MFGFSRRRGARTLIVYMMYDVQRKETAWKVPAFDGALSQTELGRVMMARGATQPEGRSARSSMPSIPYIRRRGSAGQHPRGRGGEEELGSTNYLEVIRSTKPLKKADGVFFPLNAQDGTGAVSLPLGVKGILSIELEAIGGPQGGPTRAEIHSSLKAVVDAPAWRLAQALAVLTTPDGNTIQVPGYYDAIRQPTLEEQRLATGGSSDLRQ